MQIFQCSGEGKKTRGGLTKPSQSVGLGSDINI